ncbi:hypothetical protein K0504_10445 [Neiella marina]|uniref:Polysaccharide biosynthesis protein n=1 Tax=Neiella holothuriorum TaxID=2870530 RepID=A0ABS7EGK8_9GAMM|nr:hypothetical protein [Neiella holothuriorum]MBW8191455.1 hypothetical protein [Neiella holothuriorum]
MRTKVIFSLVDQGGLSAFNFALNIFLVRYWDPSEYGLFAIFFSLSFIFTGIQNALVNTPYSVWVPAAQSSDKASMLRQTLASTNFLLIAAVSLPLVLILLTGFLPVDPSHALALSAFYAATMVREYLRSCLAAEMMLPRVLLIDVIYVLSFCIMSGGYIALYGVDAFTLYQLLWCLAAAQFIGSSTRIVSEFKRLQRCHWASWHQQYQPIWLQSRWALVGVSSTELQNRAYIFVIGAFFGTAAVGFIQAGRLLFGPLNIVVSAWTRVAKPTLAKLKGADELQQFLKLTHAGAFGFVAFNLLFSAALWLAWPFISNQIYGDKYIGVEVVVAQWALVTLLFHGRSVYSAAVQACMRFKPLAFATIVGGVGSLLALLFICLFSDSMWAVSSIIVGETIAAIYVFNLLPKRPSPAANKEVADAV